MQRRTACLATALGLWAGTSVRAEASLSALARQGGVLLVRHASTEEGLGDPAGFTLGQCSTQRNLSEAGRAEARAMGEWFRQHGLQPQAVLSSQWCRCLDTARLAFGSGAVTPWAALGSPLGTAEQAYPEHQALLRKAAAQRRALGGFEVWVTHLFVLQDLVGQSLGSAEALLLRGDPRAPDSRTAMQVLGHWRLPAG